LHDELHRLLLVCLPFCNDISFRRLYTQISAWDAKWALAKLVIIWPLKKR
jgi:hypothetical protein